MPADVMLDKHEAVQTSVQEYEVNHWLKVHAPRTVPAATQNLQDRTAAMEELN